MAPMKRKSSSVGGGAKRSRGPGPIATVVKTIGHADCLPKDLRSALTSALPIALKSYKSDRHAYESEVVSQAAQALKAAEAALKALHKDSVGKQNEIIAPGEMKKRQAALEAAEGALATAKTQIEECKAARKSAEQTVNEAVGALKAAQAEDKAAAKELKRVSDKKASLEGALANEFASLMSPQSASAATKKAVQKLVGIGKEFGLGGTLLQTLPAAAKKSAESRTEFEGMVFSKYQALIEGQITSHAQMVAEAEPVKAAKDAAVAAADGALQNAKSALADAEKALSDKQAERSECQKAVTHAAQHLRHVWEDMRKACDDQDRLAAEVTRFESDIWGAFNTMKEHEAPPPEPEPVAEEAPAEQAAEPAAAAAE